MDLFHYRDLPKHNHYKSAYRKFDWYWGLGIEHETYLKSKQVVEFQTFIQTMKPERYSVNYLSVYDTEVFYEALQKYFTERGGRITVPVLMNCHSFMYTDIFGTHKTTYEKVPKANPKFSGKTMFEWCSERSKWLTEHFGTNYVWDGDTVEFVTQGFYKARVKDVLNELRTTEDAFMAELNRLPRHGVLGQYGPFTVAAPRNEPFATHITNPGQFAMFNNGTIHINLTLPTRLGWGAAPLCWRSFVKKHRRLARLIQWLEPCLIAVYGSGDPLSQVDERFAKGSQRVAVSRYIGLGTFDTDTMPRGKILQIPRGNLPWYDWLAQRTAIQPLDKIGLDLNFNKHGAHGLELRCFDQMPWDALEEVLHRLVIVMDCSLQIQSVENPVRDPVWQSAAGEALLEGRAWMVSLDHMERFAKVFGIVNWIHKEPLGVTEFLQGLFARLNGRKDVCWKLMVGSK